MQFESIAARIALHCIALHCIASHPYLVLVRHDPAEWLQAKAHLELGAWSVELGSEMNSQSHRA